MRMHLLIVIAFPLAAWFTERPMVWDTIHVLRLLLPTVFPLEVLGVFLCIRMSAVVCLRSCSDPAGCLSPTCLLKRSQFISFISLFIFLFQIHNYFYRYCDRQSVNSSENRRQPNREIFWRGWEWLHLTSCYMSSHFAILKVGLWHRRWRLISEVFGFRKEQRGSWQCFQEWLKGHLPNCCCDLAVLLQALV